MVNKLFITVCKGMVNDIVCSNPNLDLEVHVLDYDNLERDETEFKRLEAEMEKYKQAGE